MFDVAETGLFAGVHTVPTLGIEGVAVQGLVAGDAPDIRADLVFFFEQALRFEGAVDDRAATEEVGLEPGALLGRGLELVHALENAFFDSVGHLRHGIDVVFDRQVVEHVLLLDVHAADALADDDGDLVAKGRIVGFEIGHWIGQQVAVPVLVLQPLAVERGAPGRAADHEALDPHVAG